MSGSRIKLMLEASRGETMPTEKLRIAMFLNEYYYKSITKTKRSPITQQLVLLSKELIKRGHYVELFSYVYDFTIDGFNAKGMSPKATNIFSPRLVRRCIQDFDVLHVHFLQHGKRYTHYVPLMKPFIHKKLVGTGYGSDIRRDSRLTRHRITLKFIFRLMDHLIVQDPDLKEISAKLSMKSENISIIPSALRIEKFLPERPIPEDLEDIIQNRTVVLFNARFHPFKDPLTVIKAVPLILKQRKDIVFLMSGDGELSPFVKRLCKELNIESHVFLLGWRYDIPNLLSSADIFLQMSPFENIWATSLMEAMLMGKAIIATDVGFTSRYLRDRDDVLLVESKNPKKLAEAILELIENQELRRKMGRNCRKYALKEFSCEKIIDKIEMIYFSI